MAIFMLDCDSVTASASSINSLVTQFSQLADSVNGYDTSCEDGFDFAGGKAALYDTLGPQNIDSLAGQLSFMVNEMGDDLTGKLKSATSVNDATDVFQYTYERAGKPNMENRRNQANGFYSTYSS